MAKFRLSADSVFSITANAITCVTQVDFDESVDEFISECEDANGYKPIVLSGVTARGTLTYELETDDVTKLGYLDPLTNGAWIFQPAGITAGDLKFTSTNIQIGGRSFAFSRSGLATGTASFVLDDLTIAANPV